MKFYKDDSFEFDNQTITIEDKLGEGGQGSVYLISDGTSKYALKVYKENPGDDFKYNLKNNIAKGSPSKSFLWPQKYIEFEDGTCGYLMALRPSNYSSFISYLTGKTVVKSQRVLINWCIRLVNSFKQLHERGFSYQDLNDGSFFLDPETGDLLICDNDNISADKTNLGILGKMRYMAPEIVRGDEDSITKSRQLPDVHSDRFSLAVILFLALCMGNPFEGECLKKYTIIDEKVEYEMFGSNPVYIYNQFNASNRPIRGYHSAVLNRYPQLPTYIKEAFHKTFVDGLSDRENGRVTEIEWIKLLCKYRDELMTCDCGHEYIFGFGEKKQNTKCPYCKKITRRFSYLQIGRNRIILEPNKYIYKSHLDKYSGEYMVPVAKVIQNKNKPNIWGIQLKLDNDVLIKDSLNNEKSIDKDGVIPIVNNLKIKFKEDTLGQIFVIDVDNSI
ncbi:MAG: hypothetical protein K6F14_02585 [Clostridiales bacterium]|nr:hypothetical protein [Clostridiales bacterium]